MKITISKDEDWDISSFAKAPIELLLCDDLLPTSKLLWIVLANQANFRPIDRNVLDRRIGIHRSTRARCMAELREFGFITGTESHIIINNPFPILNSLEESDKQSREQARIDFGLAEITKEEKPKANINTEKRNYFEEATQAWNKFRPDNYQKLRQLSSQLLKAIDLHMDALGIKRHDYNTFFSVLVAGVKRSKFWSEENGSKTLQSIVGIGSPQYKKYQNVQTLYNDGLEHGAVIEKNETNRQDTITLPVEWRQVIDEYDELHHMFLNMSRKDPDNLPKLSPRIIAIEKRIKEAGLDPALFRMKFQLNNWPTETPEPAKTRKVFWRYEDEL